MGKLNIEGLPTKTHIVVSLDQAVESVHYMLAVSTGKYSCHQGMYDLTIGAEGPSGPTGETGPSGLSGPSGHVGPSDFYFVTGQVVIEANTLAGAWIFPAKGETLQYPHLKRYWNLKILS